MNSLAIDVIASFGFNQQTNTLQNGSSYLFTTVQNLLGAIPGMIIYGTTLLFLPPFRLIRLALSYKSLIKKVVNQRIEDEKNFKLNYKQSTDFLTRSIHATDINEGVSKKNLQQKN